MCYDPDDANLLREKMKRELAKSGHRCDFCIFVPFDGLIVNHIIPKMCPGWGISKPYLIEG